MFTANAINFDYIKLIQCQKFIFHKTEEVLWKLVGVFLEIYQNHISYFLRRHQYSYFKKNFHFNQLMKLHNFFFNRSLKPIKFNVRSVFFIFLSYIGSIAKISLKCLNFFGQERVWEQQSESRRKRESPTILYAPGLAPEKMRTALPSSPRPR